MGGGGEWVRCVCWARLVHHMADPGPNLERKLGHFGAVLLFSDRNNLLLLQSENKQFIPKIFIPKTAKLGRSTQLR